MSLQKTITKFVIAFWFMFTMNVFYVSHKVQAEGVRQKTYILLQGILSDSGTSSYFNNLNSNLQARFTGFRLDYSYKGRYSPYDWNDPMQQSIATSADALATYMDCANIQNSDVYLIGYSLGGAVAMYYAASHAFPTSCGSAKLAGIVTIDSPVAGVSSSTIGSWCFGENKTQVARHAGIPIQDHLQGLADVEPGTITTQAMINYANSSGHPPILNIENSRDCFVPPGSARLHGGTYREINMGGSDIDTHTRPQTDPSGVVSNAIINWIQPGGYWSTPSDGTPFSGSVAVRVHAYQSGSSYLISRVQFQAFYNGQTYEMCNPTTPISGDLYDCNWNASAAGVTGDFYITFNVYDQNGVVNLTPNGYRHLVNGTSTGTPPNPPTVGGAGGTNPVCSTSPNLLTPGHLWTVDRSVSFTWQAPSTCTPAGYRFRLNTSPDPNAGPFIINTMWGATSYNYQFGNDGTYFWHVAACNPCNPESDGPWHTYEMTVQAGSANGFQVCSQVNYSGNCKTFYYTGDSNACQQMSYVTNANKSVQFLGNYQGPSYHVVLYQDTGCNTYYHDYYSRDGNNNQDIGQNLYNQYGSMKVQLIPPPGALQLVEPQSLSSFTLSTQNAQVGQVITARFGVQNIGGQAMTIRTLTTSVRYGSSWSAPAYDFPAETEITLQPGEVHYYSEQRSFPNPGGYFAQPNADAYGIGWRIVPDSSQLTFSTVNPSAPDQADQQSQTIYADALTSGWQDYSWNSTNNFSYARPYAGSNAINWQPTAAYAGFFLHTTTPVDTSGYSTLRFAVKGTYGMQQLAVEAYDANGNGLGSLVKLDSYGGYPAVDHYKVYTIPLADLGAANSHLSGFHIQDTSGSSTPAAANIDSIGLVGNLGDPWVPIPSNTFLAYDDALASGWQDWSWQSQISWTGGPAYTGNNSISWTPQAAWAGLELHNPTGIDTTPYKTVHFVMKLAQPGGQYTVFMRDINNTVIKQLPLADYGGDPVTGYWKRYDIPLADLGGDNKTISSISIGDNTGGNTLVTTYVDEVGLY